MNQSACDTEKRGEALRRVNLIASAISQSFHQQPRNSNLRDRRLLTGIALTTTLRGRHRETGQMPKYSALAEEYL